MTPSQRLQRNRASIRRIVASHRATNPRVFGSALHGTETGGSDLDILVDPAPETTLLDIGAMRRELQKLIGLPADILTPRHCRSPCTRFAD